MTERRPCPFCAEEIAAEAARCPHCRSRLLAIDPAAWHRDHPERRLAGVATAVSRALAVPLSWTRVAFVLLTFFHLIGPMLYLALWAMIPWAPKGEPPFERGLDLARSEWERFRHGGGTPTQGPAA